MKSWPAFNAVCRHLRAGLLGARPPVLHPWLAWQSLIDVSSRHYVTPALAWCLRDKAFIPPDLRNYFDAVLTLNVQRNNGLLDGLERVAAALNAIDIEPMLLKGAAHLIEGIYPAPGLRVLGDLDVLVPEDRVKSAAAALERTGFTIGEGVLPPNHHHWSALIDPETGAAVELHMGVLHRPSEGIVPVSWFWERARVVAFRGTQVRLPDATRTATHNIIHHPVDHSGYSRGQVQLRQLLDLAMIRAKHEKTIDWAEIDRYVSAAGIGPVLATNLRFAEEFFGQPAPRLTHAPLPQAVMRLREVMEEQERQLQEKRRSERQRRVERAAEWASLIASMPIDYMAARRRDPRGILDLFRPGTWPGRVQRLRTALRLPRP